MDENRPDAATVAFHLMATGRLERRRSYLARGRMMERLPISELQAIFINEIGKLAADPTGQPRWSHLNDVECEYEMRNLKAPFDLVAADLNRLFDAMQARFGALTDDDRERANTMMIADYRASTARQN